MEVRSLKFMISACAGKLVNGSGNTPVRRVSTDSRQTKAGDLFVALRGERFDGHRFLDEAIARGAAAVLVERQQVPDKALNAAVVSVPDTRRALGQMAAAYRRDFSLPLVVVGGSNGKTTTKDLIASVLRQKLTTLQSEASFNNDVGVPLTLLRLDQTHQVAVTEAGTNHPGELAPLVRMIQPRHGVITSIGREHLEFFGNLAGVADEEGALAEALPSDGTLFLAGDSEWSSRVAQRTRARRMWLGFGPANDWRLGDVGFDKRGTFFHVKAPQNEFCGVYRINLWGRHQASNALFAVALGAEFGLNPEQIRRGLEACEAPRMRLQLWEQNGVHVLDDAYNANADSVEAALQTLLELPCKGRRIAVLGDMAELGAQREAAHAEVGRRAVELGIGQLFAVGQMAAVTGRAARAAGLNRVFEFADVETAAAAVKNFVKAGDLLLLKASRAARLERIADLLRSGNGARKTG